MEKDSTFLSRSWHKRTDEKKLKKITETIYWNVWFWWRWSREFILRNRHLRLEKFQHQHQYLLFVILIRSTCLFCNNFACSIVTSYLVYIKYDEKAALIANYIENVFKPCTFKHSTIFGGTFTYVFTQNIQTRVWNVLLLYSTP